MTFDIETPIYNNFNSTHRSLCGDSVENSKVLSNINQVKVLQESDIEESHNDQFLTENFRVLNHLKCKDKCNHTLLDKDYSTITDREELKKLMSEVLIRFDTSPSNYNRADYMALMKIILSLYSQNGNTKPTSLQINEVKQPVENGVTSVVISGDQYVDVHTDDQQTKVSLDLGDILTEKDGIATVENISNYLTFENIN